MYTDFIEDEVLGKIFIRRNRLSKRLIIRHKQSGYVLTIPHRVSLQKAQQFVIKHREEIGKLTSTHKRHFPPLTEETPRELSALRVKVRPQAIDSYKATLINRLLTIDYPTQKEVTATETQLAFWKIIETYLIRIAKIELPIRTEHLAQQWGFSYQSVKIQRSKTRWGSCTQSKNINLSCYLLILPKHLQTYVILHELCHTREMNHSHRFWTEMDRVTDNQSQALRNEMKQYNIPQW